MPSKKDDSFSGTEMARGEAVIGSHLGFGRREAGAAALGFLVAEAYARDLDVGQSDQRIVFAFGNFYGRGLARL